MKAVVQARAMVLGMLCLSVTVAVTSLLLSSCGSGEQPTVSNAAMPPAQTAGSAAESHSRVETALVELGSGAHDLTLVGKVAYGEDRYSRISSPLQGRVLEVRAHLGERVQAGSCLLYTSDAADD
jgi:cobalt-zinc-cadmium efflux system membrane fusion protein